MIVARNIRVADLLRVLKNYTDDQFIDIGIIKGERNQPDQIKIFKTTNSVKTPNSSYKKFELKNLNDYI